MPKRSAEHVVAAPQPKKQKPNGISLGAAEAISSARQLQKLLVFQQDHIAELRHGIQSFKLFLESILYASDPSSTGSLQNILADFLQQSQTSQDVDESESDILVMPSIMQAWSFAAETNNDGLLSAIATVLALLLKTVSSLIDFRLVGLKLCKTILQPAQLKVVSKSLSVPKHKEHIISPTLRLLTEIVAFDGGTLASKAFAAKASTFDGKFLARNLSLWKSSSENPDEDKKRPAARTNAVRLVLAFLRSLSSAAKSELLKYGNVMHVLFQHIRNDPVDILRDILNAIRVHVLMDSSIPRSVKGNLLNEHNLGYIASLYRTEQSESESKSEGPSPSQIGHEFLLVACSDSRAGVLRSNAGWYPPDIQNDAVGDEQEHDVAEIDLGLDSVEWYNRYHNSVPVRNIALSRFAQSLRPHANILESELLINILQSAPELVADYFFKKSSFAFDPKLTSTWIGYASFLFSTVQLPVPAHYGHNQGPGRIPPPASIVIENIMPHPLSQKTLARCLNQQVELISFFAARLTCAAFLKLQAVLTQFKEAAILGGTLWNDGADRIVLEFTKRCPKIKDVIATFRKTAVDNLLKREALLRLISLYYQVIPQAALEENFDVSTALAEELKFLSEKQESGRDSPHEKTSTEVNQSGLRLLIVHHFLRIARQTPDMQWWKTPESLRLSPFMTLLKMVVNLSQDEVPQDIYLLIEAITKDHGILQQETDTPALHALIASLFPRKDHIPSDALDEFIDDAFGRLVRRPIKYEDDFDSLSTDRKNTGPMSLLIMTLAEQWPFAAERTGSSSSIAFWLGRYLLSSIEIGEDEQLIRKLHQDMLPLAKTKTDRDLLTEHEPRKLRKDISILRLKKRYEFPTSQETEKVDATRSRRSINFEEFNPPAENPKHRGLHRWSNKDIPSAVADGDVSSLILCLSSAYPEVRELALTNLRQFAKNLDAIKSTYTEAQQIYLLVGILINTVTPLIHPPPRQPNGVTTNDSPEPERPAVPYWCTVYAVLALQILQDPLHPLYPKINAFHTRGPKWDIHRLPSYWTHQILFTSPTPSFSTTTPSTTNPTRQTLPSHNSALPPPDLPTAPPPRTPHHFLLAYFYHALRTPADLALLRARGSLEPIVALAAQPFLGADLLRAVLHVVARVACIPGGSDLLVTRAGGVAWLGGLVGLLETQSGARGDGAGVGRLSAGVEGDDAKEAVAVVPLESAEGVKALVRRVWETCDREHVDAWSSGQMEGVVQGIVEE